MRHAARAFTPQALSILGDRFERPFGILHDGAPIHAMARGTEIGGRERPGRSVLAKPLRPTASDLT